MSNLAYNLDQYPETGKLVIVDKIEWLTLNAAAELPECLVAGETLRQMIIRGDVPEGHWMKVPYGETRVTYYIDKAILPRLPYQTQGGKPKVNDRKS
jgi:hypothetical protein